VDRALLSRRAVRPLAVVLAALLAISTFVALVPPPQVAAQPVDDGPGGVRITEWMYDGPGGEWVELTNVGDEPVDLAGWRYDDDSASYAAGFDLSGFGVVEAGESVLFVETQPESFRTDWGLCAAVKIAGPYTNNLGRGDQINIFDAAEELVDQLAYGDQVFPGAIRTQGASGWVSAAGLGADDALAWTLSTVGDAEGSWASTGGAVGSPGTSTQATVDVDPCAIDPDPESSAPQIAAGWRFACALDPDGAPFCWGSDVDGQIGNGTVVTGDQASPYPVDRSGLPDGTSFASIVAGASHACALTTDGDAYCWGANGSGQLGDGDGGYGIKGHVPVAVDVSGLAPGATWASLSAASALTCGLTTDGDLACWGSVASVGLGGSDVLVPTLVDDSTLPEGSAWASFQAGASSSCGLTTDGAVHCAGQNQNGQLGRGTTDAGYTSLPLGPIDTSGLPEGTTFTSVSTSGGHACATSAAGAAYCWGSAINGELGDGTWGGPKNAPNPVDATPLPEGATFTSVVTGPNASCGILADGSAWCWGFGNFGGLGDGTTQSKRGPSPVDLSAMPEGTSFLSIARGDNLACGHTTSGYACWGGDNQGQVGNGPLLTDNPSPRPTPLAPMAAVSGLPPTISIDQATVVGAVGDPTNPTATITVGDVDSPVEDLVVTTSSSNEAVLPASGVTVAGTGAERLASFEPAGRGMATVSVVVTDPEGNSQSASVQYAASADMPDTVTGRYHGGLSDLSAAIDVGDGHLLSVDDEVNTFYVHRHDVSGPPVKTFSFGHQDLGTSEEIDFEAMARIGDQLVVFGSHGNSRNGPARPERRVAVALDISGVGADIELAVTGRHEGLWAELRAWDQSNGHGLGADALGFIAGTVSGVLPNAPDGFNIEGFELAPDGTTGYLGFRAPTVDVGGEEHAVIVPVLDVLDLFDGAPGEGPAVFGDPILMDLDGRSIRDLRRNDHGEYLISAGPSPSNETWALYTWDGDPDHAPRHNIDLPANVDGWTGTWETIVSVPHPLEAGAIVRVVADDGHGSFYGTGENKDLSSGLKKSYSQDFTLADVGTEPDPDPATGLRITEWMYSGAGGEFIELTNVGGEPVDVTGWRYDDDSASYDEGFDLSGFGVVEAGESVVFTEGDAEAFRTEWDLCAATSVVGGYTNNIGRADQINVFDDDRGLVDRLTYGDEAFPGTIRTQDAAGWVSAEGLGADDVAEWTLATVGDAEGSWAAASGDVGSPGRSTRAVVAFDPCEPVEGVPTIEVDQPVVVGAVGDPTNPTATITLGDDATPVADLVVTVVTSNAGVIPAGSVTVAGDGAERVVSFDPTGRGTASVTITVTDGDGASASSTISYGASAQAPDVSGRYHHHISDASSALDVGDGHVLLADDETNTLFLHRQGESGLPVKTWTFTPAELGTSDEIDLEAVARSGDTLIWVASHGNNRSGEVRTERRTMLATTITGSGADVELAFAGRYDDLWAQLRTWDATDGHGLGADALGFAAGTTPGVEPNAPDGFNIEGFELDPDGTTGYLGFRAPTVDVDGEERALVVPVTNVLDLPTGTPGTTAATFGEPILLDLDGRSIRELRRNDHGEYLISAGPTPANGTWALYSWDGDPAHDAAFNRELPPEDGLTGGVWESIAAVPHPLEAGAEVLLVTDSGDTNLYGTGATKDLAEGYQKSYSQRFALGEVPAEPEGDFVLTLLHNNDGESKLLPAGDHGGAARFASLVAELKATAAGGDLPEGATGGGSVMISSGDNFLAGPNFSASLDLPEGEPFYDAQLIDHVGYDAMVIGNHELDFGPEVLARFIEGTTDVPFLSANLDVSPEPSLDALADAGRIAPWTVVEEDGEQIGVIGATTEGLASISSPGDIVIGEVLPAVQASVAALEGLGVDKIILASHLQSISNELALVEQLNGVDIVTSGGGDELLGDAATDPLIPGDTPVADYPRYVDDAEGNEVPVVTTAGDYRYVGRLKVRFDAAGDLVQVYEPESQPIRVSGADGDPVAVVPDATVAAEVEAPVAAYVSGLAANVVAQTEAPLDGRNPNPIRRHESNLGNLAADSILWQASQLAEGAGVAQPEVGLQNGGGIRNNSVLGAGATPGSPQPITELDTFNAMAFSNYVSVVPDVAPEQLKELLEHSVAGVPAEGGNTGGGQWGHWAGLRFTWTAAGDVQVVDPATKTVTSPGTRVIDVVLDDGTVLVDDGEITEEARPVALATIGFTAAGGDDYPFAGVAYVNLGASYQQALANHLTDAEGLDGLVTAERYPDLGQSVALGEPEVEDNPAHRRNVEAAGYPVDPEPEPEFPDVSEDHAFFEDISWLVAEGITTGYEDGTFKPTAQVSRQAMAAFLHRLAGEPAVPVGAPTFSDVPVGHPFHEAISWLAAEGISTGYEDGTFKPGQPVSREATAAFLHRMAGEPSAPEGAPMFSDVPAGHPFAAAISWLASTGITTGYDDGTFRGGEEISRQAMAAFLHRYADLEG
jgi:2',3'-cyclic-nucleotide 2'-phosphodiesterase (5'-nucleotidase family)/alpha-tubulin suppressor-like RCC1 family protein